MTLDGSKIRKFLKEKKKTREWLAVQLNCSGSTVGNLLAGKIPEGETLVRLAKVMGVQVESLIPSEAREAS